VTLLESLTTSHVECKDILQELYQSSKVSLSEALARHMASLCRILPTVFGRVKDGATPSLKHHLPSVKSFRKWNTYDGASGAKGYISTSMDNLKYQLRQDIDQALSLDAHCMAWSLANKMHELSQNFVLETCNWMDAFYQELISTLGDTKEEAWDVVGACIKKMLKMIRAPRAQAANATMDSSPTSQCTFYLWALVQSH
jgi:hypothetical protein